MKYKKCLSQLAFYSSMPKMQRRFCYIIVTLGLENFYPRKITLTEVMGRHEEEKVLLTTKSIPWIMLKKLIMLDSSGRDQIVREISYKNGNNEAFSATVESRF